MRKDKLSDGADTYSLMKVKKLINKYSDLPMDFADASVVCLAIDTGLKNIIIFDQKDFAIYRLKTSHLSLHLSQTNKNRADGLIYTDK